MSEPFPPNLALWISIAKELGLRLDRSTSYEIAATSAGPGEAALRLYLEAVSRRRRREPRLVPLDDGRLAVVVDPLVAVEARIPRATLAAARRRLLAHHASTLRAELGLPWPTIAQLLGVDERSLRRWRQAVKTGSGGDRKPDIRSIPR